MSVAASSIPHRAGDLSRWLVGSTRRLRRMPPALGIILILTVLQGVGWAVATAPWQGPDEIDHFAYAQHLAETGHAPARDGGTGSQSTDELTALLQLNLRAIELHPEGRPNWSSIHRTEAQLAHEPGWKAKNGSGPTSTANYPPLYYAYEAVVYRLSPARSLLGRLYVMRLATVPLLIGSVALAWLIAGELLAARWAQVVATGMVTLQPKMGSEGGIVNPDMMLVLFSTACLLASIRLVRAGPSVWRILWPALFAGLAVVTHPRGLFLPPFVVVAIGVAVAVTRPRWRTLVRPLAVGGAVLAAGLVLAVTWTRAHGGTSGGVAYGASNPVAGINPRQFLSYVWQFYLPKLTFMHPKLGPDYGYRQFFIETYFGSFASFSVNYRPVVSDMLQVGAGLGLAALYATVAVRWRAVVAHWRVVALAVTFFGGLMALLHIVSYGNLSGGDPVITGRYLLPAIALYGAAIAWVASSLPRRLGLPLAALLLGLSALLAVGGIGLSLVRFYA
jgi:4-amino-4-deoxy-L-arabinose transferase-like glycosyltransferase